MNPQPQTDPVEDRLRTVARSFSYPPTPDVAASVRDRLARAAVHPVRGRLQPRPSWVALALALVLFAVALLTVPEVRAAVRALFRIGSVEVVVATPTPAQGLAATPLPLWGLDLAGRTTLEDAQRQVRFPILLPDYPADIGRPTHVFVQAIPFPSAILAWVDPRQPDKPGLALYQIDGDQFAQKTADETTVLERTTVRGLDALWISGPHVILLRDPIGGSSLDVTRLVEGNVLLWEEKGITYRLESGLTLEEARKVAESLRADPGLGPPRTGPPLPRTPTPFPTPKAGIGDIGGEVTLEAARRLARFEVKLPAFPPDLGPPDRVFMQDLGGQAVLLAWVEKDNGVARMALQQLDARVGVTKEISRPDYVRQAQVNSKPALWVEGPHVISFYNSQGIPRYHWRRMVEGDVLIWEDAGITYRLETTLPFEEAVRAAESLR